MKALVISSLVLASLSPAPIQKTQPIVHPLMHVANDADESDEMNNFISGISFSCPDGTTPHDDQNLLHPHMSYKDILNGSAQLACR